MKVDEIIEKMKSCDKYKKYVEFRDERINSNNGDFFQILKRIDVLYEKHLRRDAIIDEILKNK